MNLAREVIKFFLLGVIYWAYIVWVAQRIPEQMTLLINGVFVPFLVGFAGYLGFRGHTLVRIILTTSVALFAALIASEGGDPAKPGVHLVAIAVMTAISCLGAVATAGAVAALQTLQERHKQHNR